MKKYPKYSIPVDHLSFRIFDPTTQKETIVNNSTSVMNRYYIEKTFSFDAAHVLQMLEQHKCSNFHGHTYNVTIGIEVTELDNQGFVLDFNELKPIKESLDEYFDHAVLVSAKDTKALEFFAERGSKMFVIPSYYPQATSEVIAKIIMENLVYPFLRKSGMSPTKAWVKVSETPTSCATVECRFV